MKADFAVLCTGPSMSQAVADSVRHLRVVAVNTAYELAPWAEALAANDAKWWRINPGAFHFVGRRFSTARLDRVEQIERCAMLRSSSCSGLLGIYVARRLGAERILMLGLDLHGDHYFGRYEEPLVNADKRRHAKHIEQFEHYARVNASVPIFNASVGSALKCFPYASVDEFSSR